MNIFTKLFFWCVIFSALSGCMPAHDLLVGTTDEAIRKRAGQQQPVRWKIPLGPVLVEDMQMISPGKLLVGLKKDFPEIPNFDYLLVDTETGNVLWRYQRGEGRYSLLLALQNLLLFRVDEAAKTSLLALNPGTGEKLWSIRAEGKGVPAISVFSKMQLISTVGMQKNKTQLTVFSLLNGSEKWRRIIPGTSYSLPGPIMDDCLWHFYSGVECLSLKDGSTVWHRSDLDLQGEVALPQLYGNRLLIVHGGRFSALDKRTGKTLSSAVLPADISYTSIYSDNDRVYLLGFAIGDGNMQMHALSVFNATDGALLWTYRGTEPVVSNIMENEGRLYMGTPSSLVALDSIKGTWVFGVKVSTTGTAYPVHIRKIGEKVIYIGELLVAAYDVKTGTQIYRHGISPLSSETYLNGLDASLPKLKKSAEDLGVDAYALTKKSQDRIHHLRMMESIAYSNATRTGSTDYSAAWRVRSEYSNKIFAEYMRMEGGTGTIEREQAQLQTTIKSQELFRQSILALYSRAEAGDYVYRPNLESSSTTGSFVTLSVIHLPTGKRRNTYLSPSYLNYGFWNLVDLEKGLAFHHGIGLDPASYEFSEARLMYLHGKARTINTFLIGAPVEIPR